MKLRILVDSERKPPKFGELCLLVGEGGKEGGVALARACLQVEEVSDYNGESTWTEVPMVLYSQRLQREADEQATRGRIVEMSGGLYKR